MLRGRGQSSTVPRMRLVPEFPQSIRPSPEDHGKTHRKTIGKWWFHKILMGFYGDLPSGYVKIALENHHF